MRGGNCEGVGGLALLSAGIVVECVVKTFWGVIVTLER